MQQRQLIEKILIDINQIGISISVAGDKLRLQGRTKQLPKELRTQIVSNKPEIIAYLSEVKQTQRDLSNEIQRSKRPENIPLSFAQQHLWNIAQLEPNSAFYNIPVLIRLEGELDVLALEESLAYLISRHESLRTTFDTVDGEPRQLIHDPTSITLTVIAASDAVEAQALARKEASTPFDLRHGPLLRMQLLKLAETEHYLVLTMHHIISDGWSIGLLLTELSHAYTAYAQGKVPTLSDLPIQYADFAVWQREYLRRDTLDAQLSFWRKQLIGAPALLELPTDRPRPPVQSYRGAIYLFELDGDLTAKLNQLAQKHQATLFMVLLTAFDVLLARYSRQTDIVVGTAIANRNHTEIESLVGFFVNMLALRTQLNDNPSFTRLLARVRKTTSLAYNHQDLPFEQVVDDLQLKRPLSYSPLFQVAFSLQNAETEPFALPSLTATVHSTEFLFAKYDLSLSFQESSKGLQGTFQYSTDLFDEATIARMASHFAVLLKGIVSQPDKPVLELPMLTDEEYHQMVHEWNDTAVDFGEPQTIHALFEQHAAAERTPDAVALVFDDEQLTYSELNARANQLAHHLISLGVQASSRLSLEADTLVAVVMERSIEMVISLLAVLKAGGAYVPIDPTYPTERIRYMLTDSAAPILLTQSHLFGTLRASLEFSADSEHVILVDKVGGEWPVHNPQSETSPEDLAYVIYTSGSTGQPKGVMIQHNQLYNLVCWHQREFEITSQDRASQMANPAFDATVWEIFPYLTKGATLFFTPENERLDPLALIEWFAEQDITIAFVPTPIADAILEMGSQLSELAPWVLKWLLTGGDKLNHYPPSDAKYTLVNNYGPTENTVVTTSGITACPLGINSDLVMTAPHIGKPIDNVQVYLLNEGLQLVPINVPGELYIGGTQLARGYLNRPELTAERFIEHPEFGRLYKTGDLCRWILSFDADLGNACDRRSDAGSIEFMGRTDFQVKIRGFRIELGEIENALLAADGVREAVVLAREDQKRDKRLVAYIVIEDGIVGDSDSVPGRITDTLRRHLAQRLPEYMVPSAFVCLEAMPLTPNGKLDRRALLASDAKRVDTQTTFVSPRNNVELSLAQAFAEVLRIPQISIHDNFFRMGGDSILSIQLVSRAAQEGVTVSMKDLFQNPTIAELASIITTNDPSLSPQVVASQGVQRGEAPLLNGGQLPPKTSSYRDWGEALQSATENGNFDANINDWLDGAVDMPLPFDSWFVTLQREGTRPPLFCFYPVTGTISQFSHLVPYLSRQQPVYALQARGIYDDLPPFKTVEALAADTIRAIKTIQPTGPYNLLGWSFGGRLAYEIAQQLQAQGDELALLAILDEYADNQASELIGKKRADKLAHFAQSLGLNRTIDTEHLLKLCQSALEEQADDPISSLCQLLEHEAYFFPFDAAFVERIFNVYTNNMNLFNTYQLKPYTGSIVVFAAEASDALRATGMAMWKKLVSHSVEQVTVPGTHLTLLNPEHVERLGRELEQRLK